MIRAIFASVVVLGMWWIIAFLNPEPVRTIAFWLGVGMPIIAWILMFKAKFKMDKEMEIATEQWRSERETRKTPI